MVTKVWPVFYLIIPWCCRCFPFSWIFLLSWAAAIPVSSSDLNFLLTRTQRSQCSDHTPHRAASIKTLHCTTTTYTPAIIRGGESIRQSHTIELHFILFIEQDLSLKCSAWKSFVSVMWQLWSKDVIVVVQWSISCVLKKQQLCPKDVTVVVQWSKSWCRNPWRQKNKIFLKKKCQRHIL